jgi:uncharacterized caspase-like protein
MPPIGVGSSNSTNILKTGEAKLWLLLVGINEYFDTSLPSLRYPALDCQGLEKALINATAGFPNKEVIVHHDFAAQPPSLERIRSSLQKIVSQSQSQDSIVLYFSGHGVVEANTQQAVLCFPESCKDDLLNTGLSMQELVQILGASAANQQLVCLDTCHSGDMNLLRNGGNRDGSTPSTLVNPTPQLVDVLRQRASASKGFCALLSCDRGQQSWEFPELGHGVFTYYLMQGLLGEAADTDGFIEADGLYKYVYHKTVQYIDKLNYQIRLINQQKLNRGDSKLHPEYPLQTPKRIVEGVGELIVGFQPVKIQSHKQRRALIIDGLSNGKTTADLSRLFAGAGGFEVDYFPQKGQNWSGIRGKIQEFTRWVGESETKSSSQLEVIKNTRTSLLYLRGYIEEIEDGEAWLILEDGMRLSRSLLRQELRRAQKTQQIVIVDLVISDSSIPSLENWIEDLQFATENGQCLIIAATPESESGLFSHTLLESLVTVNPQVELSIAKWIAQLQKLMQAKGIDLHVWLSGTQSVIDILPGNISTIFQDFQKLETAETKENRQENVTIPLPSQQLKKEETSEFPFSPASSIDSPELQAQQTQFNLVSGSQQYTNLEKLLKQFIGPIAPTILEETGMQAATCQEIVDKLAVYLSPKEQQQFVKRAMVILEESIAPQVEFAKSVTGYKIIDTNFISKCENELAYLIGPIANFLVKEILQSQPQISSSEFVSKLAKLIPDTKKAVEFERRIVDK